MDKEIKILAMPNSATIAADSIKLLRSQGVVIVRCDDPDKVKLVADDPTVSLLPANEFLWSAVEALGRNYAYGDAAPAVRKAFIENLGKCLDKSKPHD